MLGMTSLVLSTHSSCFQKHGVDLKKKMCFYYVYIGIRYTWAQLPKKAKTSLEDKTLPHKYWFRILSTSPCSSQANNRSIIATLGSLSGPTSCCSAPVSAEELGQATMWSPHFPQAQHGYCLLPLFPRFLWWYAQSLSAFQKLFGHRCPEKTLLLSPLTHGRAEFASVCTSVQNLQQTISCS